jgi:hypothetical protein
MAEHDLVKTVDYNSIRSKILAVLSTGSGTYGYGQVMASSFKLDHQKVSQTDWDNLRFDIVNAIVHQSGSAPSITDIQEGELISFGNNTAYDTLATQADTNRLNLGSGQFLTQAATSATKTWSGSTTPQVWLNQIECEITATFASSDAARWFFNSGGEIRIQTSRSSGTSNQQNNAWGTLLTTAGMQVFASQTPTSGFSPMNGQNFYRLTNAYQTYYTISSSVPYNANSYTLQAKCDVANNSSGTATTVYIKVIMTDGYVDPGDTPEDSPRTDEGVNGVFTITVTEKVATGSMLPSGNFTITSPTYTASAITGS